ncbi:ABC transporter permease [Lachnoanaerobaculum umeaense]|uniref:ABC transporter n=1 Tax=Lachnoanaerobaculum umeaense TaxID=617123 RepID=A0A385Q3W4_9FIRM|nr:ABC transporter permease subunit [Lachnoanaerobaculum umeaense]AYA99423.1 ABC transporter [Lachnoanaerobaculum umeaense]PZW99524.1 ABC-2 family transporter [Lachnoanaerobaculum umeaense]
MNINPIYEREHRVSTRSLKLSMAILVFNFIVAAVTLIEMNEVVDYARKTSSIDYASFLQIFKIVIFLPVILIIFVVPSFISGVISDERQRGTLEILLTTKMTTKSIVFGKFLSLFASIMLILVSQLPIIAILFLYGGITVLDIIKLVINFFVFVVLIISMGIFCSSIARKTSVATVILYSAVLGLFIGTLVLYFLAANSFIADDKNIFGIYFIKFSKFILLFNPLVSMDFLLSKIMGEDSSDILVSLFWYDNWFYINMFLDLVLSGICLALSVLKIKPHGKTRRKYGNSNL